MEVLLVIVIISIMTVVGVGLVNSQSAERQLQQKAQQWQQMLTYLCQQAVLNNRPYGIELTQLSAQVMVFEYPEWRELTQWTESLPTENLLWQIELEGRPVPLSVEFELLPHLVCFSDGQINAFNLQLQLSQLANTTFEITAETPWEITGHWHE